MRFVACYYKLNLSMRLLPVFTKVFRGTQTLTISQFLLVSSPGKI
jgi:hypothetical protein